MKKVLLLTTMFFVGMFTYCYGQDVRVNINNQDYSSNNDCEYKINGICSSEDIGGVDVEFSDGVDGRGYYVVFTNYNSFPVTVLSVIEFLDIPRIGGRAKSILKERTLNTVLAVNGTKKIKLNDFDYGEEGNVNGLIVRRLAQ